MSYHQTFAGTLTFADAHCLELGLDNFVERLEGSIVKLDDLAIDGLRVTVEMSGFAPASMYDKTLSALDRLAEYALAGHIGSTFRLDGVSHEDVMAHEVARARATAPRHRRWELWLAAKQGDAATLRELAAAGISLAQTFPAYHGWSTLHLAAAASSVEAVDLLLAARIPPDIAPGPDAVTPLHLAERVDIALRLLDAGADGERRVQGRSLMERAAGSGRGGIVRALLERGIGIPVDARLAVAIGCARHNNLQALLAIVEKVPAFDAELRHPDVMAAAIDSGDPVLVDFLLEHGAVLPHDLLPRAIRAGARALVESALRGPDALVRCGPSNERDDAMCLAAAHGKLEIMKLLADHGVPIVPATGTTTPLHEAAQSRSRGAEACMTWLLDRGVPIDTRNAAGKSALQDAAFVLQLANMAQLVMRGADESQVDLDELTEEDLERYEALLSKLA